MRIKTIVIILLKDNNNEIYETTFEEYLHANEELNIHPELNKIIKTIPNDIYKFENTIVYGPPGIGKYTQILSILKKLQSK